MKLTHNPILDWRSDEPEDHAAEFVAGARLKLAMRTNVFSAEIWACTRYLRLIGQENWDCSCKAWNRPEMRHSEKCEVTPEYAALIEELGYSPLAVDTSIGFSMFNLVWKDWP